ncbi:MAG: hypothetical protein IJ874_08635 [Ruminococcus sp.]|nr:hypothetical protein [Ruminococcus sp.]
MMSYDFTEDFLEKFPPYATDHDTDESTGYPIYIADDDGMCYVAADDNAQWLWNVSGRIPDEPIEIFDLSDDGFTAQFSTYDGDNAVFGIRMKKGSDGLWRIDDIV